MTNPHNDTPAELATWLLLDALAGAHEADGMLVGDQDQPGVLDLAHDALDQGNTARAVALLHEAMPLTAERVPNMMSAHWLGVQCQRERLHHIVQIVLQLVELKAAALVPIPASTADLFAAAEAAESFARDLRVAAGASASPKPAGRGVLLRMQGGRHG